MWARILSGRPNLDRRTIRVLIQSLWLKSLNRKAAVFWLYFLQYTLPYVHKPSTLMMDETVLVRPLSIDQPGMRNSIDVMNITQYSSMGY